jgi:hypothetical protein
LCGDARRGLFFKVFTLATFPAGESWLTALAM